MFNLILEQRAILDGSDRLGRATYSGGNAPRLDEAIPDESEDYAVNFALSLNGLQAVFILSDQDVTVKVNDWSTPEPQLDLKAGKPYVWDAESYFANLLTEDITVLYVTNDSGAAANLVIEAVVDPTPGVG
jgi:hypothetical protein